MSKSIVPLLHAIPDELCILRGRLAIVFHVRVTLENLQFLRLIKVLQLAQDRVKVRRDILDAFEDIPGIIAMAYSKSQNFPEDLKLHKSIDDLKVTLFDAIPSLLEIFMPGKFCKWFSSLVKLTSFSVNKVHSGQSDQSLSRIPSPRYTRLYPEKSAGSRGIC
jgi:hypothetical protein